MRVAVVHNDDGDRVLYRAGPPAQERMSPGTLRALLSALEEAGHEPSVVQADADLSRNVEEVLGGGDRPRGVALNRAYGLQGEARYVHAAAVLEALGVPFTGAGPLGHALCLDKLATRLVLADAGLPVPPAVHLGTGTPLSSALARVGLPAIVKPRGESASLGMHLVQDEDALEETVEAVRREFGTPLLERFVPGREVQVALLGTDPPRPLPATEVDFGPGPRIITREDKEGTSERRNVIRPADLDGPQVFQAQELAVRAFDALGCRDYARVDMRLDGEGNFWILEVNSLPGLGGLSTFPYAASLAGMDLATVLDRLVRDAWDRWLRSARTQVPREREATP